MNTPLKISIVEPSGGLYGSELALLDILERLETSAFQTEVILPRHASFGERLQKKGVASRALLWPKAHTQSRLKKLFSYFCLARLWLRQRPDLIYINQGGILRPVASIAERLRIPILCQVQTLEDARWISGLKRQHELVSTFVCNSEYISSHCSVPKDRLTTLYYGYNPKDLRPPCRPSYQSNGPFEVGLLGRICENKGHFFVIEAVRLLKQSSLHQFHFRFIGSPDDPKEGIRIESLVKQHGLTEWIEFRGYRRDIAAEFAQLHLLVIPSVAEPFGRIFCETAEAQTPALLADAGGLGELSRRFDAGVRFTPGDVKDFVGQLRRISTNYETTRRDFELASERMLNALDFTTYLSVMKDLLARAATGNPVSVKWLGGEAKNVGKVFNA